MDIGRLNKRITFYRYEDRINEYSQDVQELVKLKTVWASIEPTTGKEYLEAQRIRSELTYKIYTRYFEAASSNLIIGFKGRKFEIVSPPINQRENNEMLLFVCTEMGGD